MNLAPVDPIANAVLYEGYILYPYRPSTKNRQRWTFGGLCPQTYCASHCGDSPTSQTECLVRGIPATAFEGVVRFLHLSARAVGEVVPPLPDWPVDVEPPFRAVESLRVGETVFHTWQEAEEREVEFGAATLGDLSARPRVRPFSFPGGRRVEPLRGTAGEVLGVLVREREAVEGVVESSAVEASEGLFRVTLRVTNRTPWEGSGAGCRDDALLRSLVSTHAVLGVRGGEFVSLMDPPERWRDAAAACRNMGTWPVMVGEEGQADMMLSSPIILYDYPQVAPESQGEFFDGTEIDEMLTLRVMTMTDEEKGAMAAVDERTRALLARVEGVAREEMLALHGTVRGLRAVSEEGGHEP
jgi:hydrogenase maturation protease